jgi:regulator of RNase E activity RraB
LYLWSVGVWNAFGRSPIDGLTLARHFQWVLVRESQGSRFGEGCFVSDAWDFYFANVNDVIASLFVDLGIRDSVPDPDRPWLLWTWVYFRQPRHDGLSSAEEAPILVDIEDALTNAVKEASQAELVGCITTACRREFYFYGPQPGIFEQAIAGAMKGFPDYEYDTGTKDDPDWSQYLNVLYPSPEDHQRIKNLHVIEALEKHGDTLRKPRPVSHWAYFKSPQDRNKFIAKAVSAGFNITDQSESENSEAEHPFGVTLERTDRVDWDSINEATLALFRLAQEVNGDYDGWETAVEKVDS